jgi:hypothetical protein
MAAPLNSCPATLQGFPAGSALISPFHIGPNNPEDAICISGCNIQFPQNLGPSKHPTPTPPNDAFLGGCINTCMANYPETLMDPTNNPGSWSTVQSSFQSCTQGCRLSCRLYDATILPPSMRFNACNVDCDAICNVVPFCTGGNGNIHYPANIEAWWTAAWCTIPADTGGGPTIEFAMTGTQTNYGCVCNVLNKSTITSNGGQMCYNGASGITNHDWFA